MKIRTLTAFQPLRAKPLLCGFLSLALWGLLAGMPQAIPLAIGQAQANPEPGQPAPGFFLFDIHGQEHFLSDYVGKPRGSFGKAPPRQPVLLNFFGVACKPCEEEIPYLQKLVRQYEKEGLKLMLVSKDPKMLVQDYVEKRQLTMTVLLDEYAQVNGKYLVSGIPVLYLIGGDGKILLRRFGFDHRDNAQLELALRRLFKKPEPAVKPSAKPTPKPKVK